MVSRPEARRHFYGVGHMPDMAQRLKADFKFQEIGTALADGLESFRRARRLPARPKLPSPPTLPNSLARRAPVRRLSAGLLYTLGATFHTSGARVRLDRASRRAIAEGVRRLATE